MTKQHALPLVSTDVEVSGHLELSTWEALKTSGATKAELVEIVGEHEAETAVGLGLIGR